MQAQIKKILSYSMVGSLGLTVLASLQGCDNNTQTTAVSPSNNSSSIADATSEGLFMVIQQTGANPDTYELKEKYPSAEGSRAILKGLDGSERILNEAELKQIAEAEAKRFEEGNSQLSQPLAENQGLSLGETILASAAGALIGGMLANKLMSNQNYQRHQQQQAQKPQTTMSSTRKPAPTTNTANQNKSPPRSGFFGGNQGKASNSSGGGSGSSGG
ncbi:hypothetical protein SAMN02745130_01133 [Thiothrix eikelboomii]|uniref:UPF0323 domain-containing protein n=1 Tax=Thiothrix eikelboomii TaxID=92487 RepID=A0A1T4W5X7_9GAMM|nr:hypothetical protein [Thiothrix eikelboomii]SKA72597.1 hypothetical protein SAMN02745130_01133 [Thiothrix eikelboomii]